MAAKQTSKPVLLVCSFIKMQLIYVRDDQFMLPRVPDPQSQADLALCIMAEMSWSGVSSFVSLLLGAYKEIRQKMSA